MEIKSDIICKGAIWYKVGREYGYNEKPKFFDTFWASFKLCMAIGILYDKQLDDESDYEEEEKMTLPRSMFNRHAEEMKFFFQSAILTSNCIEDLSEKDRLFLAFSEDVSEDEMEGDDYETLTKGVSNKALNFDRVLFLKKFANYGASKLVEQLSEIDTETMENLAEFLTTSYNGETDELIKLKEVEQLEDEEFIEDRDAC